MRRELLIQYMESLEAQGLGCRGCQGNCCTFEANSMMMTPLETLELVRYLRQMNQQNEELKTKLLETVRKYRLEHPLGNGRRSFLRKTYTCPFFNPGELGCPLPREVKPYGCLAFNSHHAELKAQEHCYSDIDLLQRREDLYLSLENEANERIKKDLGLSWDKTPLPLALLEMWDAP